MNYFLLMLWWASGVLGGYLMWLDWKYKFPEDVGRCPTRAGALAIFFAGALGALILLSALFIRFADYFDEREQNPDSWWRKPICRD